MYIIHNTHISPPSSMKQCNKSATVKFHMELLLTTTIFLLRDLRRINSISVISRRQLLIHVFRTIFNQYLNSSLSLHRRASRSAIPIIRNVTGKATTTSFKDFGLSRPRIEPTTFRSQGGRSNH